MTSRISSVVATANETFSAAIHSVGTAATLAAVGFYLHQRGALHGEGKKALASLSKQVTFPLFLCTKLINCDVAEMPCMNVTYLLKDAWILLLWPILVVASGLGVGFLTARLAQAPQAQYPAIMAALAFPNNTGLPITLLAAVHSNFPATSVLGRVDPNLFLSVYLLVYPILQWGIGGYLLARPEVKCQTGAEENLNYGNCETQRLVDHLGEALYAAVEKEERRDLERNDENPVLTPCSSSGTVSTLPLSLPPPSLWSKLRDFLSHAIQPPVMGAITGIIIATTPLRGLFVNVQNPTLRTPLKWLFAGLYHVGLAAVPINMMILGCNLSMSFERFRSSVNDRKNTNTEANVIIATPSDDVHSLHFSKRTLGLVVVGKMAVLPMIGLMCCALMRAYVLHIPADIAVSFYLVMTITFLTPTANNVMVMVELSGSDARESLANSIALQYLAAPVVLSLTMTVAIAVANSPWIVSGS